MHLRTVSQRRDVSLRNATKKVSRLRRSPLKMEEGKSYTRRTSQKVELLIEVSKIQGSFNDYEKLNGSYQMLLLCNGTPIPMLLSYPW
jgi:hypothetical protein